MMKWRKFSATLTAVGMTMVLFGAFQREEVAAKDSLLNLVITVGTTETATYGVPNAFKRRLSVIEQQVETAYYRNFGITLVFSMPKTNYVVKGPGDECRWDTGNYDVCCQHSNMCNNNGPYHHTNCSYVCQSVFPRPRPYVAGGEVYITAHRICNVSGYDDGSVSISDSRHQAGINGMTYPNIQTIIVRDSDYAHEKNVGQGDTQHTSYISKTLAHEIGHLYGVEDHYDVRYGDERDKCIWGSRKDEASVRYGLYMCETCRETILNNKDKFTPQ